MSEQTPNAGEKVAPDEAGLCCFCNHQYSVRDGCEDTGICDSCAQDFYHEHCKGTGFKRAVESPAAALKKGGDEACPSQLETTGFKVGLHAPTEPQAPVGAVSSSPAADVKELEVESKYQHPTTLLEFEAVYRLEYRQELDSSDKWINWCEEHEDTHGMHFHQGVKSSAVFHNQKMEQLLRVLKQEEPNINTKLSAKDSQIADLTTKLATLQVEKEKMLRTTTDAIINFVECQTKCDQFDTDLLKSTVLNEKLNYELTTLRAENQGLVKEVERLREVLNQCRCALGGYKMTHRLHEESVLNKALVAAQEALKPTPEGE